MLRNSVSADFDTHIIAEMDELSKHADKRKRVQDNYHYLELTDVYTSDHRTSPPGSITGMRTRRTPVGAPG